MKSRFLSYGAGMQTFALLVMAEQGEIQIDEVVFANTGAEHPETYALVSRRL
jgi:3'-phosphoadenosine 5'-phosphosulfate sulfotransferase (PAPS reductase)/FAD synthetase